MISINLILFERREENYMICLKLVLYFNLNSMLHGHI
jgi:hypothetical protein